jgi:hypothetical protein
MNPLLDFAMAHVRRCAPQYIGLDVLHHITSSFSLVLAGAPIANLAGLLQVTIGTTAPLDRICAVLQMTDDKTPGTPPPASDAGSLRQKPRPWCENEDNRLLAGIHRFGLESWWSVAQFVGGGRTRAQCAQRWTRGLDPHLSRSEWSYEDEEKLLRFASEYGSKRWTRIAAAMGNRSDVQCRYHFIQMQKDGLIEREKTELGESWKRVISPIQAKMIARQQNDLSIARLAEIAFGRAQKKPRPPPPAGAKVLVEEASEIPWVNEPSQPDDSYLFPWLGDRSHETSFGVMDMDTMSMDW